MNIFALSECPEQSALWLSDVHGAYRLYMNDRWKERNIALTWRWGEEPEWRN